MAIAVLQLPSGVLQTITSRTVLGRGSGLGSSVQVSRQQLALTPTVGNHPSWAMLENLGVNPLIVQRPDTTGALMHGHELKQGDAPMHICPGTRFHVLSAEATTACLLVSCNEARAEASNCDQINDHGRFTAQGKASATLVIDLTLSEGTAGEPSHRPLAGGELTLGGGGAGAGAEVTSPAGKKRRTDLERSVAVPSQPAQQTATAGPVQEGPPPPAGGRPAAHAASERLEPQAPLGLHAAVHMDAPFHLMRVRGLPPAYNSGCLGASLSFLVAGPIEMAVVINFMIDLPWLLTACPELRNARRLLVCHGDSPEHHLPSLATLGLPAMLHKPEVPGWGTHHSKAFLLQYPTGLRVIIHTANLIHPDCNYKSQAVWWQDFPVKDAASPPTSDFEEYLCGYMARTLSTPACQGAVLDMLRRHDMSSARAALVGSVPGDFRNPSDQRSYGHLRVRHLLQQQEEGSSSRANDPVSSSQAPGTTPRAQIVVQCSSMGSLDPAWLAAFSTSLAVGASASGGTSGAALAALMSASASQGQGAVRVVWPTEQEVQGSLEGWLAGASIPGHVSNVERPFLKEIMCKFGGDAVGRSRAMPHIKSYCRWEGHRLAWVMVGSHNLSRAAWGNMTKGQAFKLLSFELSVLCAPGLEAAYRTHRHCGFTCLQHPSVPPPPRRLQHGQRVEFWTLEHVALHGPGCENGDVSVMPAPLPYRLPPAKYVPGQDVPWMLGVRHHGTDSLGNKHGQLARVMYGFADDEWA